jgi:hypothetical protein
MAEVSSFSPFAPPAESSTAAGKRRRRPLIESSPDEISDVSDDDMPKKDKEAPSGVAVPEVNVEMASPPHGQEETLPIVTGNV